MWHFDQEIADLARSLIGAGLLVRGIGGTILETEAYGRDDPASHSFRGPSRRNAAMFGPPGSVYVYLSYGCHLCLNVVGRAGEAVLIRAILPEVGVPLMDLRRNGGRPLAAGPGRVGQALGIGLGDSGKRFGAGEFHLQPGPTVAEVLVGPRIGITRAADRPWRFGLAGAQGLSRTFPVREQSAATAVSSPSITWETAMPAKSKAQQKAAGAALAAKRGEADKGDLFGASKEMERSMTERELEALASTPRKKLPERKD